jgi:hypothetical protein
MNDPDIPAFEIPVMSIRFPHIPNEQFCCCLSVETTKIHTWWRICCRGEPIPEGGLSGGAGGAPVFERPEGFEDKSHFTPEEAEEFVANFDAYIEDQVKSSEGESFVGVETGLEWGTLSNRILQTPW